MNPYRPQPSDIGPDSLPLLLTFCALGTLCLLCAPCILQMGEFAWEEINRLTDWLRPKVEPVAARFRAWRARNEFEDSILDGYSYQPICTPDACHADTPDPAELPFDGAYHRFLNESQERRADLAQLN